MSARVEDLVRLLGSPAAVTAIAPDLPVSGGVRVDLTGAGVEDPGERDGLAAEGFSVVRRVAERSICTALIGAIESFGARELPATFVFAFDDAWAIGEQIRSRVSTMLGRDYRLVEDIWAWHIPPGRGRGWPAHRGIVHERLDRDAPEIINVWVALSDVGPERACMHAVPLDDDPGYPGALERTDAPLSSVRALPVSAGDALFWNANVIHWGGRCSSRAAGPRVSCSFTVCRADAMARFPDLVPLRSLGELDLAARMEAVARMILVYGGADRGDVRGVVREWASLTHALASRFANPQATSA